MKTTCDKYGPIDHSFLLGTKGRDLYQTKKLLWVQQKLFSWDIANVFIYVPRKPRKPRKPQKPRKHWKPRKPQIPSRFVRYIIVHFLVLLKNVKTNTQRTNFSIKPWFKLI